MNDGQQPQKATVTGQPKPPWVLSPMATAMPQTTFLATPLPPKEFPVNLLSLTKLQKVLFASGSSYGAEDITDL
ncbi:hypothetical protein DPEC_G00170030 [Dallia pectoralis]|uniref:Uncharacterized protein n=1 Tax=Dallia pectoralis TaxID=75939 RepID=A0ACC2GDA3_DALPE|nr:hypothetical protein DPEC_G00170030 [Dallia pectoralis]